MVLSGPVDDWFFLPAMLYELETRRRLYHGPGAKLEYTRGVAGGGEPR